MELHKDDYILGYWFTSNKDDDCWYMMMVKRGDQWLGQYTFRYNESSEEDDPFSGKDRKNIYTITVPGNVEEDEVIKNTDNVWEIIKKEYGGFSDKFFIRGDVGKFLEIAKTKEYLHLKSEPL